MSEHVQSIDTMRRVRLSAKIIHNDRSSIFDCVVRSLSSSAAVLEMPNTIGVPRAFYLKIKPANEEHECEVSSRTETQISVTFGFKQTRIGPSLRAAPSRRRGALTSARRPA